jgi:hypothetical protein
MKIKLQDYSLISNEWIETQINVVKGLDGILKSSDSKAILNVYDLIKQQLIPSEKLADKSWDEGWHFGIVDGNAFPSKQKYLKSEIEIL